MSDQTPPDQATSTSERGSVDVGARLAHLTAPAPRTTVSSTWPRRDPVPAPPSPDASEHAAAASHGTAEKASPPAPTPAGRGIGRLSRVSAADLWSDATAMAAWIGANADVLSELIPVEGLRFRTPMAGTVVGADADGSPVCVVCEVGPSSDEALGTLLRTAAIQGGGTVVWLNGGPTESHVAALSWLNRATPPRFFLARASGVRIDGSASAPMFDLVVRPPRGHGAAGATGDAPQRRVEDHLPGD